MHEKRYSADGHMSESLRILFRGKDDRIEQVTKIVEEQGIDNAIEIVCGIEKESTIHSLIKTFYSMLINGESLEIITRKLEIIKNNWVKNKKTIYNFMIFQNCTTKMV